jgi:hypothetical protein
MIFLMVHERRRTANTTLTLLNVCAWAYALLTTAHAVV